MTQDCDCKDKSQCWEPCGDLGHSEEHAQPAEPLIDDDGEVRELTKEDFLKFKPLKVNHKFKEE